MSPVLTHLPAAAATRLLGAVLAKTFVEIAFVCALVAAAAFATFSPLLRGAIDVADAARVAGWAHDPWRPSEAVEVQLYIDGQFAGAGLAGEPRPDLVAAGAARTPNHGFSFDPGTLAPGRHEAQVFAVRPAPGERRILLPLAPAPVVFHINP